MAEETDIGGPRRGFPATRPSLVARMASDDANERRLANADLVTAYWKPVYRVLRVHLRKSNEDAKDATQAFFAGAVERGFLADYDPARARFRTFVRLCLERFCANRDRAERAAKRGGGQAPLDLDFVAAEAEVRQLEPLADDTVAACFEREWRRVLITDAVERLAAECREHGRELRFALFRRRDLDADGAIVSYEQLAAEHAIDVHKVTNELAAARRRFREIVLESLRHQSVDDDDFRDDLRALIGRNAP